MDGKPDTNVVSLSNFAGERPVRRRHKAPAATAYDFAADPIAADGLRLIRSFLLIQDCDARASIINTVEKALAAQSSTFKNK